MIGQKVTQRARGSGRWRRREDGGHQGGKDAAEHQRTFDAFIRFWVYVFGAASLIRSSSPIFNT